MAEKQKNEGESRTLYAAASILIAIAVLAAAVAVFWLMPGVYHSADNDAALGKNTLPLSGAPSLAEAGELVPGGLYALGSYPQNVPSGTDAANAEPMPIVWRLLEALSIDFSLKP